MPEDATTTQYVGRFAPSPSGPLHMGSLVCALASYLDAKANNGKWLVRIEDIDPPREKPKADILILECLKAHGFTWDGDVLYQSQRSDAFHETLEALMQRGLSYRCPCTRKRLSALNNIYDGHCRHKNIGSSTPAALRCNTALALHNRNNQSITFLDTLQGNISENFQTSGDFVIHRKDGLFAYQIAVTTDDIAQKVTHVVRGYDLLETTTKQILLYNALNAKPPQYAHIPIITCNNGIKLSKQNHSPAINNKNALNNLKKACIAMQLFPPSTLDNIPSLLEWAISSWDINKLRGKKQINRSELDTIV